MLKLVSAFFLMFSLSLSAIAEENHPLVLVKTNYGDITLELNAEKAPITVKNFLRYVDEGFYSETLFHRVIDGFMVQGGGLDYTLTKKPTHEAIQNEADNGLKNTVGTVAMARTGDPRSATSQFFINVANNGFLDHRSKHSGRSWGYTVFGKVVKGMSVVDKIRKVETTTMRGRRDVPKEPVAILSIERFKG